MDELTEKEESVKISVDSGRFIRFVDGIQMSDYRVCYDQGDTVYVQDRDMR